MNAVFSKYAWKILIAPWDNLTPTKMFLKFVTDVGQC